MKSHEASLGKLQRCLRLPGKLKLQWKEGKWSFPSTLGQHGSSPQITQSKLELSEHVFILVTQPRCFLGSMSSRRDTCMCTAPAEGTAQKPLPGCQPGRRQWPTVGGCYLSANLLEEDGAQHWDWQWPVALPEGLQGMRCSVEEGAPRALRCSRR